jgi:uncharacterized protein YbaR (Trm112 family)
MNEKRIASKTTYTFRQAPGQPGNEDCDDCYGLGWTLISGAVKKCNPCDVYADDAAAAEDAAKRVAKMYARIGPDEQLVRGYGYEPFVLHRLRQATDVCPRCDSELTAIEAGYDRYGTVSLEGKVLVIEDAGFSDDGNGPGYLYCGQCNQAYALPDDVEHR